MDALRAVLDEGSAADLPATARLRHVVRRGVEVLAAEPPYLTLLPRVRGDRGAGHRAWRRRRGCDRRVAERPACGSLRPGAVGALTDQAARVDLRVVGTGGEPVDQQRQVAALPDHRRPGLEDVLVRDDPADQYGRAPLVLDDPSGGPVVGAPVGPGELQR